MDATTRPSDESSRLANAVAPLPRRTANDDLALLLHPNSHVGDRELQVLAEVVGARAEAGVPPDGRDKHAEVGRYLEPGGGVGSMTSR